MTFSITYLTVTELGQGLHLLENDRGLGQFHLAVSSGRNGPIAEKQRKNKTASPAMMAQDEDGVDEARLWSMG